MTSSYFCQRLVGMRSAARRGSLCCMCAASFAVACVSQPEGGSDNVTHRSEQLSLTAKPTIFKATIRRTPNLVEVEVVSNPPFRDSAMPPLLIIGDKVFGRSRNPPDGRLDTLIFRIDPTEFDALPEAAELSVGYLSPSARLTQGRPAARASGAAPVWPRIRPDQVQPGSERLGSLLKSSLEVLP